MTLDFIGFGTTKAASTWIFRCLSEHPEICGSSEKETRFFDNSFNFKKGLSWYEQFFTHHQLGQIKGEFSPSYIYEPQTAHRIYETFPHVKLIAVFRNPIEKVYSSFWSNKTGGRGSMTPFKTFEQAFHAIPSMARSALHGQQYKIYYDLFPKEHLHTLLYDDILHDPEKTMKQIYQFLGVDDTFIAPSTHRGVNETGDKRVSHQWLFKIIYRIYWQIKKIPWLFRLVKKCNTTKVSITLGRMLSSRGGKKFIKPSMSIETREKLLRYFKADIALLGQLIDRDVSSWK